MSVSTLRVLAVGTALVQSLEHMKANPRRFVGRQWVNVDGKAALDALTEPTEVPFRAEYVQAVREGALAPADRETADACGVPFEPS